MGRLQDNTVHGSTLDITDTCNANLQIFSRRYSEFAQFVVVGRFAFDVHLLNCDMPIFPPTWGKTPQIICFPGPQLFISSSATYLVGAGGMKGEIGIPALETRVTQVF